MFSAFIGLLRDGKTCPSDATPHPYHLRQTLIVDLGVFYCWAHMQTLTALQYHTVGNYHQSI